MQAFAREFVVKYAMNNSITDDELEYLGSNGILRSPDYFAVNFELIQRNTRAIEYTIYPIVTTIVYMYGNTIILVQQLGGPESSSMFHFKFSNDGKCREFQQLLNPISFQSGEVGTVAITWYFP